MERARVGPGAAHEAPRGGGQQAATGAGGPGDAGQRLVGQRAGIGVEHRHLRPRLRRPAPGHRQERLPVESQLGEVRGDPARLVVGRPDGQAALLGRCPRGAAEPDHPPPIQVQLEAGPWQHALQVLAERGGGAGEPADRREHDTGAQCGTQRVGDDRGLAERLRAEQAQAVGGTGSRTRRAGAPPARCGSGPHGPGGHRARPCQCGTAGGRGQEPGLRGA